MLSLSFLFPAQAVFAFFDDFNRPDGDPGPNWTAESGNWAIVNEELHQTTVNTNYRMRIAVNLLSSEHLTVEADVKFLDLSHPYDWTYAGFAVKYKSLSEFYWIVLRQNSDGSGNPAYDLTLELCKHYTRIETVYLGFVGQLDTFYNLKVEVLGNDFKVYVDDVLKITATDDTYAGEGDVMLWAGRCAAAFDNVSVHNPGPVNVVPEPGTLAVSLLFVVALTVFLLKRRNIDKAATNNRDAAIVDGSGTTFAGPGLWIDTLSNAAAHRPAQSITSPSPA
jgi:hypothetical protein